MRKLLMCSGLRWGRLLLIIGLLVGDVHAADPVRSALERGFFAEESDGDLEAASKAYHEAVRAQAETREMGATALYRLGEVYRKLGRTSDARQMFERLTREFPEQTRWVGLGTVRLTELPPKEARKPQESVVFQENLLRQELLIAEQAAAEVQKRIEIGAMAPMEAVGPKREVLRIQRQLLALKDRATGAGTGLGANRAEQRLLLVQELELAQQGQKATQAMMENGKATKTELLLATKPVLGLQRELAEFDNATAEAAGTTGTGIESPKLATATVDDDELKEVRRLEALLKESPDLLNAVQADQLTLVETAASRGRMRELRFLVESGADVKRTFPLHLAAEAGRKSVVEYLLTRGVNVNALNRSGRTALHLAAAWGRAAVVETLIQAGASTEAQVLPRVPQSIRPVDGSLAFADPLKEEFATALHLAALEGHGAVIEALLRGKANVQATNRTGCTALHLAVQRGQWEAFKLLLEKGAEPDALDSRGITPALMTCSSKLGEVTRSSAQPHSPADYLRLLLSRGVDPNGRKGQWMETLRAAVLVEDVELVECLLKAGAKPQIVGSNGMPLLFAALDRRNAIPLTRLLLQYGVDPDVHSKIFTSATAAGLGDYFWSPMFYIVRQQSSDTEVLQRNLSVLKLLLEAGADPNQANPISGLTPIWFASGRGIGEALIDAGAYLDQPDRDGWPMTSRWTVNAAAEAIPGSVAAPGGNRINGAVERPRPTLLPTPSLGDWQSKRAELVGRRGGLWLRSDFNRIRLKLGSELQLAFERGKHDWNHFTALEVLMKGHRVLSGIGREREQQGGPPPPFQLENGMYRTGIDWTRILIHRPEPNGTNWQRIPVDLSSVLFRTNCAGDFEMKWGDVIETKPMPGGGTGYLESKTFGCLKRSIRLTVEGETFERVLDPGAKQNAPETFSQLGGIFEAGTLLSMMGYDSEKYALEKTLVVRRDRQTGTEARMEIDLSRGIQPVDDLWLQDGDRLEFGLRKTEPSVEWAGKVTVFGSRYLAIPVRRGEQLSLGEILRRAGVEREPSSELSRIKVYRFGGDGELGEQRVNWGSKDAGGEGVVLRAGEMVEVPIRRVAL